MITRHHRSRDHWTRNMSFARRPIWSNRLSRTVVEILSLPHRSGDMTWPKVQSFITID